MDIKNLGFTGEMKAYGAAHELESFETGRVIAEHRERYTVKTAEDVYDAELLGNLRFTAESREDFPAVGDWVAITPYDEDKALIHAIYPRYSIMARQAVDKKGEKQVIATNIDFGLIVQSVNRDFSINRLDRYLTICHSAKIRPIIILSKIDLIGEEELGTILTQINSRIKDIPILTVSNQEENGYDQVIERVESGKTYCLLGSSGVGKSTLLNYLSGQEQMKTGAISESIDRGKHVTSHRELVALDGGGILIDNPGMREVGIADASGGLDMTFDEIVALSADCKYKDCTHLHEEGFAILEALANGELEQNAYDNYLKMYKEKMHFEANQEEKKKRDKNLGKMIKQFKKARKQNKY
ncbi:MAG: ribosome small subunit-dependent GTPase A [Reichenbachiella sp.]|uniref:ribosome small subunit-dependent GTPase A n=1 Tax=Reichenbachiella sp. TaxID=2184521 RepID=UPI00326514A2